jgi:hypothetical protein
MALGRRDRSVLDLDAAAEDGVVADPAVDEATVVADLEAGALNCLEEVQVFPAIYLAENDVAHLERAVVLNWIDGAKLTRFDFALHRAAARAELNSSTFEQLGDVVSCPSHGEVTLQSASGNKVLPASRTLADHRLALSSRCHVMVEKHRNVSMILRLEGLVT